MRTSFIQTFIILAALGAGVYLYRAPVKVFAVQAFSRVAPCSIPLTYSVGEIDPRFGISTSSLVSAMAKAGAVWNTAAGKSLFIYEPSGGILTVNLVYDKRQATTQELGQLGEKLSSTAESYDTVKSAYDAALSDYQAKKQSFDSAYASYTAESNAYEASVRKWNARGGAPSGTYAELQAQKTRLDQEETTLRALQDDVNADADQVNALVQKLNGLATTVNAQASQYNTVGRSTGAEFEEGVFESQPGHEEIDVYEYDSAARLARLIAHEFGHSIGLDHVDDPDAIMYRLNQGTSMALTSADLSEFDTICHLK